MTSKYLWLLVRQLRKIWVRVVSLAALAVVTVVVAQLLGEYIPSAWTDQVGAASVDQVLGILASSMLAVTTFSLSIAVSAFAAAAGSATPRATALLQEDTTTQNVLATFLGAFLFSLVGIIALKAGYFTQSGLLVLFIATAGVVAFVVLALLRWISHLMSFGRIEDTLGRVEAAATQALKRRLERPWLGGNPQREDPPDDQFQLRAGSVGYVQHVDMQALSQCAGESDWHLWLLVLPGSFVDTTRPVLIVEGAEPDETQQTELLAAITIGHTRDFDQDPRFGVVVLGEIASRALSPAVNDPGTAIGVIGRMVRVLSLWDSEVEAEVEFPDVTVPTLQASDLIEDGFRPIARDGAGIIEVQMRLQKALAGLRNLHRKTFDAPATALSDYALEQAANAGLSDSEMKILRDIAKRGETRRQA